MKILVVDDHALIRGRLIGKVETAVDSMNELFDALLDMSRLDAGVLEPDVSEFPLQRLLQRIETTFAGAAREKGLSLRVAPTRAWVRSDFVLLERILFNLSANAVRYTAHGAVAIGCRRRGPFVRIDVLDSGPGIAEEFQRDIFSEFYQVARPHMDRSGLGLGLSIVQRLCHLLGHKVELSSRPGQGARFSIVVPRVQHDRPEEVPIDFAGPAEGAAGRLVVVIDDDEMVLDGMRDLMQSWGWEVLTCASADGAISELGGRQPDLIISDCRLAGGASGIEATETLREAFSGSVPALLISGDTGPERLSEAQAAGYLLLRKPVAPMALRTTLGRVLRAGDPGRPSSG